MLPRPEEWHSILSEFYRQYPNDADMIQRKIRDEFRVTISLEDIAHGPVLVQRRIWNQVEPGKEYPACFFNSR